jgi:hypothetical protein
MKTVSQPNGSRNKGFGEHTYYVNVGRRLKQLVTQKYHIRVVRRRPSGFGDWRSYFKIRNRFEKSSVQSRNPGRGINSSPAFANDG